MKYNFKNVALFATAILTIGAFSACSNEIENIDETQKETKTITFTVTLGEDDPLSRTLYEEVAVGNGIKFKTKWEDGDKLYIGLVNTDNTAQQEDKYDIENTESGFVTAYATNITNEGKTATFNVEPNAIWKEGQQINVLYGDKSKISIFKLKDFATISINKSENRTVGNNFLDYHLGKYDYMSATTTYSDGMIGNFTLKHEMSVIKFPLKGLDSGDEIKYFEIKSEDNSPIFAYRAYLNNDTGYKTAAPETNLFNTNTKYTSIKEDNGFWNVYIVIPPTTATEGKNINITVNNTNAETYTATLYNFSALEAGKVYVTPEITMTKQE